MINIYTKTHQEIVDEKRLHYWVSREIKDIEKPVCLTYVINNDGTRVDTNDLTENDILNLIEYDIKDFKAVDGSYKRNGNNYPDAFKLIEALGTNYTPTYDGIFRLYQMKQQYGHIIADITGGLVYKVTDKARMIAKFQKECNGDFSQVSDEDIVSIIQQMNINEIAKKQQYSIKR